MPQQKKPRNGNGPRQTYYLNKPIKSPHKTTFKTPPPLTYQFAYKKQVIREDDPFLFRADNPPRY